MLLDFQQEDWQELGSREVSILFTTLVIASYVETFPKIGIGGAEKALGNGVANCGSDLQFTAYRRKKDLEEAVEFFAKIFINDPEVLTEVHKKIGQAVSQVLDELKKLKAVMRQSELSSIELAGFYKMFHKAFVDFFPLQVLPFSIEQVMIAGGKQDLLDKQASLMVEWRSSVHKIQIVIEDVLDEFFQKTKACLGEDFRYWSDSELIEYFEKRTKLPVSVVADRKKCSVVLWQTALNVPYEVISGQTAIEACRLLQAERGTDVFVTEFAGRPTFPGKVEAEAFVVLKKEDFKNIPDNAIVVVKVVEVDDARWFKNGKVRAVITEEGGITTHIAILSRELKIPTIVGVKGIVEAVKIGTKLSVDAVGGKIKILN